MNFDIQKTVFDSIFDSKKILIFQKKISFSEKTHSEKIVFVHISFTSKFLFSRDDDSNVNDSNAKNTKFEKKNCRNFEKS